MYPRIVFFIRIFVLFVIRILRVRSIRISIRITIRISIRGYEYFVDTKYPYKYSYKWSYDVNAWDRRHTLPVCILHQFQVKIRKNFLYEYSYINTNIRIFIRIFVYFIRIFVLSADSYYPRIVRIFANNSQSFYYSYLFPRISKITIRNTSTTLPQIQTLILVHVMHK